MEGIQPDRLGGLYSSSYRSIDPIIRSFRLMVETG
jgi:hypothetical protein